MDWIWDRHRVRITDGTGRKVAEITFPDAAQDTVDIHHTWVDESLRGRGIAGEMMTALADKLRREHKKACASCPYAQKWFLHHPEYADIFIPDKES